MTVSRLSPWLKRDGLAHSGPASVGGRIEEGAFRLLFLGRQFSLSILPGDLLRHGGDEGVYGRDEKERSRF